ncbi:hypothetical protein FJTKL_06331 [Diaporthe vaccinii]|uniref:Uncharacterized protein n=1 Tax=Diaporthe vaccinii TaxID=105482 RepID=A0ABR4DQ64_9PEZI
MVVPPSEKLRIKRWKRMKTVFSKVDQLAQLETQVFLVIQHCFSDKMHIYHSDPELDFPSKSWFDIRRKTYPPPVLKTPETMAAMRAAAKAEARASSEGILGASASTASAGEAELDALEDPVVGHVGDANIHVHQAAVDVHNDAASKDAPQPRQPAAITTFPSPHSTGWARTTRSTPSERLVSTFKNSSGPCPSSPDTEQAGTALRPPHGDMFEKRRLVPCSPKAAKPTSSTPPQTARLRGRPKGVQKAMSPAGRVTRKAAPRAPYRHDTRDHTREKT